MKHSVTDSLTQANVVWDGLPCKPSKLSDKVEQAEALACEVEPCQNKKKKKIIIILCLSQRENFRNLSMPMISIEVQEFFLHLNIRLLLCLAQYLWGNLDMFAKYR